MSKLYINDLEKIKEGKLLKLNFEYPDSSDEISLLKINNQIKDYRYIRNCIIKTFQNDIKQEVERLKGDRIENDCNIICDHEKLFLSKYLSLTIPTMFGDTACLISENGLASASFETTELLEIIELIMPYIKGLLNVRNKTNILNNEFYSGVNLYNYDGEKVLNINGNGIVLPFDDYNDLTDGELQELLAYYYVNYKNILKNILIPDGNVLNCFRTDVSEPKVLALYNGRN